ncbi:MAG: VWA domain-containing protein [Candidatus Competibacteraceae bacterium]|nr:VWA domain-containing protein [Candidatus Competibacteraceae bacterium]
MLNLAYPWLLVLLPLPWLVRRFMSPHRQIRLGLYAPFIDRLAELTGQTPQSGATVAANPPMQLLLMLVIWCLLVVALARPVWLDDPLVKVIPARDLLVAIDLSGSMEREDFSDEKGQQLSRMDGVKQVLDAFLANRDGDRVGLIFFGTGAFVQAPFTDDLQVVQLLLEEAQPRMAGPKTALGDAIGLAMTLFERSDLDDRVLILLTDGNDTGSLVPPERAAELAKQRNVVIHAIGVGDSTAAGEEPLDEKLLQQITQATGGEYFFAADRANLTGVTEKIDALTPREAETITHRPRFDLFHWPLGVALLLSLPYPLLTALGRRSATHNGISEAEQTS